MHNPSKITCMGVLFLLVILLIGPACAEDAPDQSEPDFLEPVSTTIQTSLNSIDRNLSVMAQKFGESGADNTPEAVVSRDEINRPGFAGVILICGENTSAVVNPSIITGTLNESLALDPAVQDSIRYIKPKMGLIRDISDVDEGVLISRPTLVDDLIGSAAALIIPWSLGEAEIRPLINGTDNLALIMQGDGTVLYTSHPTELQKVPPENFMTEFPTFRDVKTAMMTEKEGQVTYELWRPDRDSPKARNANWNTVNLHGTEWRILVASPV